MSVSTSASRPGGSRHRLTDASSGHTATRPAPAPASTSFARCALSRASNPPFASITTTHGAAPCPRRASRSAAAWNPAISRTSVVVLPEPVVPTTSKWEHSAANGISSTGRGLLPTDRITAPSTGSPRGDSSGTPPGARTRSDAVRTDRRHCRSSNATAAPGDQPAAPEAISPIRDRHAPAPIKRPSGIAVGAITTIARSQSPPASACQARTHA